MKSLGKNSVQGSKTRTAGSVIIPKFEWDSLLAKVDVLSENQKSLTSDLRKANLRISELEGIIQSQKNEKMPNSKTSQPRKNTGSNDSIIDDQNEWKVVSRRKRKSKKNINGEITSTDRSTEVPKAPTEPRKSWADIASLNRAPRMTDISESMKQKIFEARKTIEIMSPKPSPTAVYFRKIKRAQLGVIRQSLGNLNLPPWAMLGLSFIGQSVLEVLCDKKQVPQLIVKLTLLGAQHIKEFDIFAGNLKKKSNTGNGNKMKANAEKVKHRLKKLLSTTTNATAKSWYTEKLSEAEKRLSNLSIVGDENSTNEPEPELIEIDNRKPYL